MDPSTLFVAVFKKVAKPNKQVITPIRKTPKTKEPLKLPKKKNEQTSAVAAEFDPLVNKSDNIDLDPDRPVKRDQCGLPVPMWASWKHSQLHKQHKQSFPCPFCPSLFSCKFHAKRHVENFHAVGKFSCPFCPFKYGTSKYLEEHLSKKHKTEATFCCPTCKQHFGSLTHLRNHQIEEGTNCSFGCDFCTNSFLSREDLDAHVALFHSCFKCKQCDQGFDTSAKLRAHNRDFHFEVQKHSCKLCGDGFDLKYKLESHLVDAHGQPKKHLCHKCGLLFVTNQILDWHIKMKHSGTERFVCEHCVKPYPDRNALMDHLRREHQQLFSVRCSICKEIYKDKTLLENHIQEIHFGLQPPDPMAQPSGSFSPQCNVCGKHFLTLQQVNKHTSTVHTNERPLVCDDCNQRFKDKGSLTIHTRLHSGILPFSCRYCSKRFRQTVSRRIHEVKVHTKSYGYSCVKCGLKFIFRKDLRDHSCGPAKR